MPTSLSFRRWFHALTALLLLASRTSAPARDVISSREPPPTFFTKADLVEVTPDSTTVSRSIRFGQWEKDVYLLAVPAGKLEADVTALKLRHVITGEVTDVMALEDAGLKRQTISDFRGRVTVKEFGVFRRSRTARLEVDRTRPVLMGKMSCEVAEYSVKVTHPGAGPEVEAKDSAFREGMYREFLEAIVAEPAVIDRFALPGGPSPFPGPTSWQPRAAASPGFPWLRFSVSKAGVYTIDGRTLEGAGIDPSSVKPGELSVYTGGKEVPTALLGPEGAGFPGGQRLLFHGEGTDSTETDGRAYYIGRISPGEQAARIGERAKGEGQPVEVVSYRRRFLAEEDALFKTKLGSFLSVQKMLWVWKDLKAGEPCEIAFDAPGIVQGNGDELTTATLAFHLSDTNLPGGTEIEVRTGQAVVHQGPFTRTSDHVTFAIPSSRLLQAGNTLTVTLRGPGAAEPANGKGNGVSIDSLELVYTSLIAARDGRLDLQFDPSADIKAGPARLRATGFRAQRLLAFDVTDPGMPLRLPVSGSRGVAMLDADLKPGTHLLLSEEDYLERIPSAEKVADATWDSRGHSADVLVVHHAVFAEAAALLAENLRANGMTVEEVDVQSVYDSFSGGQVSSEAIRNFLAFATHEWSGRRPFAAILVGDANGDGRNISRQGIPNFVPMHTIDAGQRQTGNRISTESYYSWLNEGDEAADLVVGRIPSSQPSEAMATVRNIIAYRAAQDSTDAWKGRIAYIADTGGFSKSAESLIEEFGDAGLEQLLISADDQPWEDNYYLPANLISRDEDSKVSGAMTAAIEDVYTEGVGLSLFFGHGAPNLWSNQRFWFGGGTPNSDILRTQNVGRLPFVTSFTCNNAVVDYPLKPWNVCIAEDFLRHEGRGAIACFMPTGPGYLTSHETLAEGLLGGWLTLGIREQGLLAEFSRLNQQVRATPDDHSRMFVFLGDPTLKLRAAPPREGRAAAPVVDDGSVLIEQLAVVDEPTTSSLQGRWNVMLTNGSRLAQSYRLRLALVDDGGVRIHEEARELTIPGSSKALEPVALVLPKAGVYRLTAEVVSASGAKYTASTPCKLTVQDFATPAADGVLRLVASSFSFREATPPGRDTKLEIRYVNGSASPRSGEATVSIEAAGRVIQKVRRPLAVLAPGKSASFFVNAGGGWDWKDALAVKVALRATTDQEAAPDDTREFTLRRADLPDLGFVEDSIRVSPESPSEGGTIFISGEIRNEGGAISAPVALLPYSDEDTSLTQPLRDLARSPGRDLAAMKPRETRSFRLRWDPAGVSGNRTIVLAIDPSGAGADGNPSNNRVSVPLSIRSKARLVPAGLRLERGENGASIVLHASVSNPGETDSKPVVVNFHRSGQQTDDTKIGEVILPRVPAGSTVEAVYTWDTTGMVIDQATFSPSFSLALKGSLMRVSSVTP